jgi:hypothetical protein
MSGPITPGVSQNKHKVPQNVDFWAKQVRDKVLIVYVAHQVKNDAYEQVS